jgi:hypothetical protein
MLGLAGCRTQVGPERAPPADDPSDAWDALLREAVTPEGYVDYDVVAANREPLDAFVAWLGKPRPKRDREAPRHAWYLNAHNALVIWGVLHDGRPASVRDVPGRLPFAGSGFFFERTFLLDGYPTSLHEVGHEWLRGRIMDARDHAALNHGMRSSPPLRDGLYTPDGLGEQLDAQMARWLADPARGLRLEGDTLVLSPIFERFAWDFAHFTAEPDLCLALAAWADPPLDEVLRAHAATGCRRRFFDDDPALNDASGGYGRGSEGR